MLNSRLKVGDIQSGPFTATSCRSSCERVVGSSLACGLDKKKDLMLKHDKWSAALLLIPAMCSMQRFILYCTTKNHRQRNRCMTSASLEEPFFTTPTTPMLSHWSSTVFWKSWCLHATQLSTIGTISLAILCMGCQSSDHFHCSQSPWMKAPQPREPEASICMIAWGATDGAIKLTPFHSLMNVYHHWVKWSSCLTLAATLYIRPTNIRLGRTTLAACCSRPTRDSIWRFVAEHLFNQDQISWRIFCNLLSGRRASMWTVSSRMPKNSSEVEGPSNFSTASGIFNILNECLQVLLALGRVRSPNG